MQSLIDIDRRLFAPVCRRHVERITAALAAVIAVRLATGTYWELAALPDAMFNPPWFLSWMSGPPHEIAIVVVQALGVASAVVAVVLRGRGRAAFVGGWVALVVLAGMQTSVNLIHNDVLLIFACLPFLFMARSVPAVEVDRGDTDRPLVEGWQPRVAMILVASGYFLAGAVKLRHSGLDWVFSENLRWVLYSGARQSRSVLPEVARAVADHLWLTMVIAGATLATELLFPLAVVWRRVRPWFVAAAVSLHVGVFLTLGLDYWSWVAVVLILFVPWTGRAVSAVTRLEADRLVRWRSQSPAAVGSPGSRP